MIAPYFLTSTVNINSSLYCSNHSTMTTKMMSYMLIACALLAIFDNTSVVAPRLSRVARKLMFKRCCKRIKCNYPNKCVFVSLHVIDKDGCKCIINGLITPRWRATPYSYLLSVTTDYIVCICSVAVRPENFNYIVFCSQRERILLL